MSEYPNITDPDPNPTESSYTQLVAVGNITDGYTPVNKVGAANTFGMEIAKIANFVNATNLGFSTNPVQTANIKYITYTNTENGINYTATFGTSFSSGVLEAIFRKENSHSDIETLRCEPTSIELYNHHHIANEPYNIYSVLTSSGLSFGGGTTVHDEVLSDLTRSALHFYDILHTYDTQYSASGIFNLQSNGNTDFSIVSNGDIYIKAFQHIILGSSLVPENGVLVSVGNLDFPFPYGSFGSLDLIYPATEYSANASSRLWVDASGFVRRGPNV